MERLSCGLGELKFAGDAQTMTFAGYGAVFGNVDSYGDVISPGAFADTLANARKTGQWPAMLSQHGGWGIGADDMTPIGIWTDMSEDGHGLKVEGRLADTPRGREAYTLLKMEPRPAINGLSIGYIAKEWSARSKPDEPRRTLKKVDLLEISLVTFPANPKARIGSVKATDYDIREFERHLCGTLGFSRSDALVVINQGFKALKATRDAGDTSEAIEALLRRNIEILSPKG